ncbi:MAG: magnesium chelatase, partial [Planctomycetota bacterium]
TREHDDLALGGSPRASIALFRTSQAMAAMRGRNYVTPDDVKRVASPVLTHRMILKPEARLRKVDAAGVVNEIVAEVAVPTIEKPTTDKNAART